MYKITLANSLFRPIDFKLTEKNYPEQQGHRLYYYIFDALPRLVMVSTEVLQVDG